MSDGGGYYEPGRGQGQRVHQGAAGQPEQVRGKHNHEDTKVAKVNRTEGEAEGTGVSEVAASEVMASEVTAPIEETHVDPMTKDDLKEKEEVNGEQGVQMDTPMGTTEMTLTWVITVGMAVLYQ